MLTMKGILILLLFLSLACTPVSAQESRPSTREFVQVFAFSAALRGGPNQTDVSTWTTILDGMLDRVNAIRAQFTAAELAPQSSFVINLSEGEGKDTLLLHIKRPRLGANLQVFAIYRPKSGPEIENVLPLPVRDGWSVQVDMAWTREGKFTLRLKEENSKSPEVQHQIKMNGRPRRIQFLAGPGEIQWYVQLGHVEH